jgi:hypothetical protein
MSAKIFRSTLQIFRLHSSVFVQCLGVNSSLWIWQRSRQNSPLSSRILHNEEARSPLARDVARLPSRRSRTSTARFAYLLSPPLSSNALLLYSGRKLTLR